MHRWWSRTRGIESEQYATWRATLTEVPGRQPRILAWAASADGGLVILSPAAVSERSDGDWRHTGWHEIERGGWNAETGRLHWQTYAGRRAALALADPGNLPAVFKERVDASIVFEQFVPLTAGSDRRIVAEDSGDNRLAVFHYAGDRWLGTETINRPADHMLGRRMMAEGFSPGAELVEAGTGAVKAAFEEWRRARP